MNSTSNRASNRPMNRPTNRHGSATVTLPSDCEILITRQFDAPADVVFRAWTTPELVRRWWGFDTSKWLVCEIDLREGESWRYVTREPGPDGEAFEVGFHGVFRTVDAPRRLVSTEVYEGFPDAEAINTMVLDERDGVTTMTVTVLHSCQEHRDGHVASGMEGGMQISMNRLEDVVVDLGPT